MSRLAAAAIAGIVFFPSAAGAQTPYPEVNALQTWIHAVNTHVPGKPDAAIAAVAPWTYAQRRQLNSAIDLFFDVLTPRPGRRVQLRGEAAKQIAATARALRETPGTALFLKRAALLHTDAAIAEYKFPPPVDDVPRSSDVMRPGQRPPPTPPPLLTNEVLVLDKDGEVLGDVLANWNWPFARFLLDKLLVVEGPDFVRDWYHATTAYMYSDGLYGDAIPHLRRAAALFPEDAEILFDRACYAESLGLPIHQVLAGEKTVNLPSASHTNEEAERLFARAVAADPSSGEARVRLARLLGIRGRHDAALAQLREALALKPTGEVAFYAHLFAGREAQAVDQLDEAAAHYRAASALFPNAQSALLGASEVALLKGDMTGVQAPLRHLGEHSAEGSDPWWIYQLASGRDVGALMSALWKKL